LVDTFLAIYGAVLSSLVATWAIYSVLRDRTSLKVEVLYGLSEEILGNPQIRWYPRHLIKGSAEFLLVRIQNGRRPVTLRNVSILFQDQTATSCSGIDSTLPIRLEEGQQFIGAYPLMGFQERFKQTWKQPPWWAFWGINAWTFVETDGGRNFKKRLPKDVIGVLLQEDQVVA
jgi:hypothetical protein